MVCAQLWVNVWFFLFRLQLQLLKGCPVARVGFTMAETENNQEKFLCPQGLTLIKTTKGWSSVDVLVIDIN